MKKTYRDSYVEALEAAMKKRFSILPGGTNMASTYSGKSIVSLVEGRNHSRLTKKTALWFYQKVQAELAHIIKKPSYGQPGIDTLSQKLAEEIIKESRAGALGLTSESNTDASVHASASNMAAFVSGAEFSSMMVAVKPCISKSATVDSARMVQLVATKTEKGAEIVAYASDGYRIMRRAAKCMLPNGTFSGFIDIPRIKPKATDMVKIVPTKDGMTVSFAEVSFNYAAPKSIRDIPELYQKLEKEFEEGPDVYLNPTYLKELATGMIAGVEFASPLKNVPVKLSLQKSQLGAVKLECGKAQGFLLPVRPPREK